MRLLKKKKKTNTDREKKLINNIEIVIPNIPVFSQIKNFVVCYVKS